eukprot:TRINITY_DN18924_c0_g1::TRINITY_DN18924_c0_g1_i1::g.1527::m.1527 TRINITY_DN18924_c0_g1::TRINITY_DN18924_c0_g1_i1::g.1527  ORF type:complete len:425 (-),score=70.19,sp/Q9X5T6/MMCR_STRLA/32.58/8e-36,Methyltransf_2/PF00891.13/5.6e-51,Methyltransf_18/PF12847.2/1.7e-06,Methyltransf_31/PF13847.1/0.0001,MTS/PF05175.9/0.013,Methyltransf_12/PF08242.7/0.02,zf-C2H2_6/PF13912.1/0.35 TRINITY_DN18924_c0_g1_i1:168-1397(-)
MWFFRSAFRIALLSIIIYAVHEHMTRGIKFSDPTVPAAKLLPWPVFSFATAVMQVIHRLTHTKPVLPRMMDLSTAYWKSSVTYTFTKLEIADTIRDRSLSCEEIAPLLPLQPIHTPFLCRLIAAAETLDLVNSQNGKYRATALGLLTTEHGTDGTDSMKYWVQMMNEESLLAWHHIVDSVHTGNSGFKEAFGEEFWDWHSKHPEKFEQFSKAMSSVSTDAPALIAGELDLSQDTLLCDVGGSRGNVLMAIMKHYPHLKGKLFDLPKAIESAKENVASQGFSDRIEFLAGSFFNSTQGLEDCSTLLMKHVIHDWSDEDSVEILSSVANSMQPNARLVLVEFVLGGDWPFMEQVKLLMDINMMASNHPGARERSLKDYTSIAEKAGLEFSRLLPTRSATSLIEFKPKPKTA